MKRIGGLSWLNYIVLGVIILIAFFLVALKSRSKINWPRQSWESPRKSDEMNPLKVLIPSEIDFKAHNFSCPTAKYWPLKTFPICVYTAEQDYTASAPLLKGVFKSDSDSAILGNLMKELDKDSDMIFIDIGANLGIYALPVGHLKRNQVIAVEANYGTIVRLSKSVFLGQVGEYVTLVHNAVSDTYTSLGLDIDEGNRGDVKVKELNDSCPPGRNCPSKNIVQTIKMDDLLPIMKSRKAVIKADVQGHEKHVFSSGADKFFAQVHVPMIVFEWDFFKVGHRQGKFKRGEIDDWLKTFFFRRNYTALHPHTSGKVDPNWENWPYDILFRK